MADIIDVQNALATIIAAALYPNGTGQASVTNSPIVVYPGWPESATLDTDLAAGKCHVTIFPKNEERNTTRYSNAQQATVAAAPTLTASVVAQTITIGGTVTTPQNIALIINGAPYVYPVLANDTPTTIAAALAALVAVNIAGTTSSGPVITIGTTGRIQAARVNSNATVAAEIRRQERVFMITVWADTPTHRDTVGAALDVALAQTEFLSMPDGFGARLIYKNSPVNDGLQKEHLYRRDINYSVEYATTVSSTATPVIVEQTNITGGIDPTAPVVKTIYQ